MVAAQAHGVRDRTGLSRDQADRAAWTVTDGEQAGGPMAVALFLAVAWKSKLPLLPWKVPGVPWVLDRIYEMIANSRRRLPSDTPWCVANPDACEPD